MSFYSNKPLGGFMTKKFFSIFVVIFACQGLSSEQMPYCKETSAEIPIDQPSDLRFSGADLLLLAQGQHNSDFKWNYKDQITQLTMRVDTAAMTATYIESEAVYPDGGMGIGIICPNRLEVPVWLTFVSQDGAFNERRFTKLVETDGTECIGDLDGSCHEPGSQAHIKLGFTLDQLIGNFFRDVRVPTDVSLNFNLYANFSTDIITTEVSGYAIQCNNDVCSSTYIDAGESL